MRAISPMWTELDGVGWDAPFGRGRPGWHIECSAMAKEVLGETIDIHCGGVDLKFPHHENEIAQSECAHGKTMANYWVHNEFLNLDSEKMSKSLGNVKLINDLLKDWDGEVIRLALLKAHYRSELIWSEDLLKESKAQLDGWYRFLLKHHRVTADNICLSNHNHSFRVFCEDLSTIYLIKHIGRLTKIFEQNENTQPQTMASFIYSVNLLGLLQKDPEEWFKGGASSEDEAKFDAIAKRRATARAEKNWAEADAARDEAKALGIVLEDNPDGTTTWRRA